MRKIVLVVILLVMFLRGQAQNGYIVSGKIQNVAVHQVSLVSSETGNLDTLGEAIVNNGSFLIQGCVDGVQEAQLVFEGVDAVVPFLLENAVFQVMVTPRGIALQGGGAEQQLLRKYNQVVQDFAVIQKQIQTDAMKVQGDEIKLKELQMRADEAYKKSAEKTMMLIKANARSYATAYVIAAGIRDETEESLRKKYELLDESIHETMPAKKIAVVLERYKKLTDGNMAPNFTVKNPRGDSFALYDVHCKLKLLHFWISDNLDCRQINSELVRLYQDYRSRGLEIVSISLDKNVAEWKHAVGSDGVIWQNGSELKGWESESVGLYMVKNIPYFVLIDAENRIVAKGIKEAELEKNILELLKKRK